MALTDENGGMNATMLMQPAYGIPYGGGFGGGYGMGNDFMSWILLLLVLGGSWGGFGGFGMGGAMMGMGMMGMDYLYPWINNSQNINDGFRDQQLSTQVNGIQSAIQSLASQLCECCGNMRYDMSQGFNGVERSVTGAQTALAQQMYANQIADMERSYAAQTATAQGFNGVQAGLADTKYTIATEECATMRGGSSNARRRDAMGRYSRENRRGEYSRDAARADMVDDLRDLMRNAPDEHTRAKFQRFIDEVEND